MPSGGPRDSVGSDMEAGRPIVAADVDELACRCAKLLDTKRLEWFCNSIEYRIRQSPAYHRWGAEPTVYLEDLDPDVASSIRAHVMAIYAKERATAIKRGWEAADQEDA